jgi:hypothetical protein
MHTREALTVVHKPGVRLRFVEQRVGDTGRHPQWRAGSLTPSRGKR